MSIKIIAATIVLLGAAVQVMAEDAPKPWKGEAGLGVVATNGNTKTKTIKGYAGVVYEKEHWRHTGKLDVLNSSDAVRTTAERYMLSGKSDYKFDELNYMFGLIGYENDRFAGFSYRLSEVVGYGRRVINQSNLTLDLEAGPGARQTKFISGDSDNELIGRVAGNLLWKLSPTASFTENLTSEFGSKATISRSVTALTAQLMGNLAMKLSYTVRHISDVPVAVKKMDTETAVTLVYGF